MSRCERTTMKEHNGDHHDFIGKAIEFFAGVIRRLRQRRFASQELIRDAEKVKKDARGSRFMPPGQGEMRDAHKMIAGAQELIAKAIKRSLQAIKRSLRRNLRLLRRKNSSLKA